MVGAVPSYPQAERCTGTGGLPDDLDNDTAGRQRGTGTSAWRETARSLHLAGKTGTINNNVDTRFAGGRR